MRIKQTSLYLSISTAPVTEVCQGLFSFWKWLVPTAPLVLIRKDEDNSAFIHDVQELTGNPPLVLENQAKRGWFHYKTTVDLQKLAIVEVTDLEGMVALVDKHWRTTVGNWIFLLLQGELPTLMSRLTETEPKYLYRMISRGDLEEILEGMYYAFAESFDDGFIMGDFAEDFNAEIFAKMKTLTPNMDA